MIDLRSVWSIPPQHVHAHSSSIFPWARCVVSLTSLSKLSECSSSMPSSRLTWWNFLVMLRWRSRSWRVSEFSMRPSTKWLWKACEYWGKPTSLNQAFATQWWSMSAALDNLLAEQQRIRNTMFPPGVHSWRHTIDMWKGRRLCEQLNRSQASVCARFTPGRETALSLRSCCCSYSCSMIPVTSASLCENFSLDIKFQKAAPTFFPVFWSPPLSPSFLSMMSG